jgi:hypothetical protein
MVVVAPDNAYGAASNRIWHWNGTAWSNISLPVIAPIAHLSATAADDVFAQTAQEVFHFDGTRWLPIRVPTDSSVLGHTIVGIQATRSFIDLIYSTKLGQTPMRRLYRTKLWDCAVSELNCSDGVDDDCDERVDSLDSDCP